MQIHYRGKVPETVLNWWYIYTSIVLVAVERIRVDEQQELERLEQLQRQKTEVNAEIRELEAIRYLRQIDSTGTVVHKGRMMSDLIGLLERGWLEEIDGKRYVTAEGKRVLGLSS